MSFSGLVLLLLGVGVFWKVFKDPTPYLKNLLDGKSMAELVKSMTQKEFMEFSLTSIKSTATSFFYSLMFFPFVVRVAMLHDVGNRVLNIAALLLMVIRASHFVYTLWKATTYNTEEEYTVETLDGHSVPMKSMHKPLPMPTELEDTLEHVNYLLLGSFVIYHAVLAM